MPLPRLRYLTPLVVGSAVVLSACTATTNETIPDIPVPATTAPAATEPSTAPSESPPTATPSTPATDRERVMEQYKAFLRVITPVTNAPADQRRALLEPYVTEPALSSMLRNVADMAARGRGSYGAPIPRARVIAIGNGRAVIEDCQDGSQTGETDRGTDHKLTKGPTRDPVQALFKLESDGVWRVGTVKFLEGEKC